MEHKCLYCCQPLDKDGDFHDKCSMEFFGVANPPEVGYSLDQMDELAKRVVERSVTVPGVQAKLSMTMIRETKEKSDNRLTVIGALGGRYILKPPSTHFPEMPANEHLTMRIAEAYGITVVPSSLIRLVSGELCYITRRVDRTPEEDKIHMIDMFQITEAFDKYRSSMEKVGKALGQYSENPLLDKVFYFELALFSFLTGNNDMHLKNFSMIQGPAGWVLAPAYDLLNVAIIIPDDEEELALTLAGKKKKLKKQNFDQLGQGMGMTAKQIEGAYRRMKKNRPKAMDWIQRSLLSEGLKQAYEGVLETRYRQLDLL